MKPSIRTRLDQARERHEEIAALMADPAVIADTARFRTLGQEYARLEPVVTCLRAFEGADARLTSAVALRSDADADLRALAEDEIVTATRERDTLEAELERLLIPPDPHDERNVFLELRAGTGGAEAALFAGDLARMYLRYGERRGWNSETVSESPGEHGGYKELVLRLSGPGVYARLKFEAGTHRVQRVPETEAQGRIHTSAVTVAVLPEPEAVDAIDINPADLRTDTYRASGAGGQHVNKTDSAVRITHIPSGIVVECQDERSQHKNRARAMSLLKARLLAAETERQESAQAAERRRMVGSGDRSERIRTWNFPQGRVTDHRIDLTLYQLATIIEGDLDPVIEPLIREHQAERLAALANDA